jgi:endonuclease-3
VSKEEAVKRVREIIKRLEEEYPDAKIALKFSNPLELLVATILSAQTTDKKVNEVTQKRLFKKYRSAEDYANTPLEELQNDIRELGFFRMKAKHIQEAARIILEKFKGEVPRTMEEILTLPGVARKTANIVLSNAYGVVVGIPVDTHVKRLSQRLGLSSNKDPNKIEEELMEIVPKEKWFKFPYLLIDHGRKICDAKKPRCDICVLNDICPSASKAK